MKILLILFVSLMLGVSPAFSATENVLKTQLTPYSTLIPKIDGRVERAEWSDAVPLCGFTYGADVKLASVQTLVLSKWSGKGIFLAFTAFEPMMDKLKADDVGRDGKLWWNDSIEIFLQPRPASNEYFHFIIDAAANQFDEICKSSGWNADWEVKVRHLPDKWTAEVFLPFAAFGTTPKLGDVWRVNYARARVGKGETDESMATQWSPAAGNYHRPETFGALIFSAPGTKVDGKFSKALFGKLFSYPGPTVRLFTKKGYFDILYTGIAHTVDYGKIDQAAIDKVEKWMSKLKELGKNEKISVDNAKVLSALLKKYDPSTLNAGDCKANPILKWTRQRQLNQKVLSTIRKTYWKIRTDNIRRKLLEAGASSEKTPE